MTEAAEAALRGAPLSGAQPLSLRARVGAATRSHPWLIVAAFVLAGVLVRLIVFRGIWVDEAISIHQAHMSLPGMLGDLRRTDNHPPLYFLLLWGDVRVFGFSELAVRLPSILAGTALIPALYLAGRDLFDRRTGLVVAALGAVGPMVVWYSQEARMYELFMLLATLSVWAQARVLREGRLRWWAAYTALTIALLYTHYFAVIPVAIEQLAFAAVAWRRAHRGLPIRQLLIGCWVVWIALTLALIPLAPFVAQQFLHTQSNGTGFSNGPSAVGSAGASTLSVYAVLTNLVWGIWGYHADSAMIRIAALWPLLMLVALVLLGRRRSPALLYVAALAFVPMLALLAMSAGKQSLFDVRYYAGAIPMLLLLCARALTSGALRRTAALASVGVLVASMLVGLADEQLNGSNPRNYDFRGALAQVRQSAKPGDSLLYAPNYLRDVVSYYTPGIPARPLRGDHPAAPRRGGVFLLGSFLHSPRQAAQLGAAKYSLAHSGRRLVRDSALRNIDVWEYR